jgi:hypothetical protein
MAPPRQNSVRAGRSAASNTGSQVRTGASHTGPSSAGWPESCDTVLPGADSDDPESDPITDSNDLKDAGDVRGALRILMELCQADLRRTECRRG